MASTRNGGICMARTNNRLTGSGLFGSTRMRRGRFILACCVGNSKRSPATRIHVPVVSSLSYIVGMPRGSVTSNC